MTQMNRHFTCARDDRVLGSSRLAQWQNSVVPRRRSGTEHRLTGTVKWFDPDEGWGVITSPRRPRGVSTHSAQRRRGIKMRSPASRSGWVTVAATLRWRSFGSRELPADLCRQRYSSSAVGVGANACG